MKKIFFITGNPSKAEYLAKFFNWPIEHKKIDLKEIQSLSLEEIVTEKAREAYKITQAPVLVEDISLSFNVYNGLPGSLIRWFMDSVGNKGLLKMMENESNRSATTKVCFCFFDGEDPKVFSGEVKGEISHEEKGGNGFGWDPIFIPNGSSKTFAEMTDEEKHQNSMRIIALNKLSDFLKGIDEN